MKEIEKNVSESNKIVIPVQVNQQEIDNLIKKASRLSELLKEANSLARELASHDLLKVNIEI